MKQEKTDPLRRRKKGGPSFQSMSKDDVNNEEKENLLDSDEEGVDPGCCSRFSRGMQNKSYAWMASTVWDNVVSGFKPGRMKALHLLDIQPDDTILFVGEGSGLDFDCLPETVDKNKLKAFDFSPEMVKQSKIKAQEYGIPEDNCFVGDAQDMSFATEQFDKIYFPLSLASIPNPKRALQEAERILAPGGKIVIFDKMLDEETVVSCGRKALNLITNSIFADINRKLPTMMGNNSPLKITHYESLNHQLEGVFANTVSDHYRLAVLVRTADYPDEPTLSATLRC